MMVLCPFFQVGNGLEIRLDRCLLQVGQQAKQTGKIIDMGNSGVFVHAGKHGIDCRKAALQGVQNFLWFLHLSAKWASDGMPLRGQQFSL